MVFVLQKNISMDTNQASNAKGESPNPKMRAKQIQKGVTMKTSEEIREILENQVDWTAVHHARVAEHGQRVELWLEEDGTVEIVTMEQNTFQPGVEIIGSLCCWGLGNMDTTVYTDGWTTANEDGTYTVTETGEVFDESDIVHRCIDEGEWYDYPEWIDQIVSEHEREYQCAALHGNR